MYFQEINLRKNLSKLFNIFVEYEVSTQHVLNSTKMGDWKIDTIIGKNPKHAIVSIVERVSKKTILRKVENKSAENVANETMAGLVPFVNLVKPIMGDYYCKFAYHEKISGDLETDFYFTHPFLMGT